MTPTFDPASLPLRDIHLPPPVGWWPPAPGWWLLAALMVGAVLLTVYLIVRRRRSRLWRIARRRLVELGQTYKAHGDRVRLAGDLSTLLRQVAISRYGRRHCGGLIGRYWLEFLNEKADSELFAGESAEALLTAPYCVTAEYSAEVLLATVDRWLKLALQP
jgi:hypothetical protein